MHGFVNFLKDPYREGGFIKQERNCMWASSEIYVYIYIFVKFTFNKDHSVASAWISVLTQYHQRGSALSNKDQRSSDLSKTLVPMISQCHWEQCVVAAQLLGHIWLFATPWTACSISGFHVLHYLPEFAQTQVQRVGDAIQPSHPLSPSFPPALNVSQHQGLFPSGGQSIRASASASVLPMNIQGFFPLGLTGLMSLNSPRTLGNTGPSV